VTHQAITPFPTETALKIFRAMISTVGTLTVSQKQNTKRSIDSHFFLRACRAMQEDLSSEDMHVVDAAIKDRSEW